ncbi:MAG: hypothetical protein AAFN27_16810 [Pseudomonadota bacterium]
MTIPNIDHHHRAVRRRIIGDVPGWAQTEIAGNLVSYSRTEGITGAPAPGNALAEMLVDVARDEGIASPGTFSRSFVAQRIDDLRRRPAWALKAHRQAHLLEAFYLNGDGGQYLYA